MDNVLLISVMFLVAALNTFVVIIAIRLIFKIKVKKEEIADHIKEEISTKPPMPESSELNIPVIAQEEKTLEPETEEKKGNVIPEAINEHPKFLKYTAKGYINPGDDVKKKKHIWR